MNEFRALCGPHDPVIAKCLYPNSLRAQFGVDRIKNVMHCTDLPEDGILEVYFFKENSSNNIFFKCEYFFTIL